MGRPVRDSAGHSGRGAATAGPVGATIFAAGLLGALLLLVAEFTTLFDVHAATSSAAVSTVGTGSHHGYALVPIALLAALLAGAVWARGSRPALLAIGVLGVIALLIALLGDLPDAQASGLIGSTSSHYVTASSTPSAGLYMETLGAVVLVITCVCGFLLLGPPVGRARPRRPPLSEP